ncbi:MAG TPA: ABC transporter permease [Actinomycetota bacterium]|nr:ABC transporter permease [Actinomycetota bacterium]
MSQAAARPTGTVVDRLRGSVASGGMVWTIVLALVLLSALVSEDFRTASNLVNVARQAVVLSLVSLGQFLVVVSGGVDLSLGMIVKITAISGAITMGGFDERLVLGLAIALLLGLVAGMTNGVIVTWFRVPAFIATLGSMAVLQGIALLITTVPKGKTSPLLGAFWGWRLGPIYGVVILMLLIWTVFWLLLNFTVWGRHVYAIGGDVRISRSSGVRVRAVQVSVFVVAGVLAALGGVLTAARAGIGDPNAGFGLEFESLAAVVIGGASLLGGRGRLIGVFGGVMLLSLIGNVFNFIGVDVWYQQLLKGTIILLGSAAYVGRRRGAAS